jgi:predicted membrane protein
VKILFVLLVFLVLLNSFVLPFWFNKLWFLFVTTSVLICLSLFRILTRKERDYTKSIFLVLFFISLFNLLVAILGYTTNFAITSSKKRVEQKDVLCQTQKDTVIKGRVVMLDNSDIPVANAKISISQANNIIDTFYTDIDGKFEYIVSKEVDLNDYISLRIEHLDFKPYETKFLLTAGTIRELEVYLCKPVKK